MSGYRIPEIAKQYTEHDMIQQYMDLPDFPEFRTRLLYAFLPKDEASHASGELYTLVATLLQMGMDTHDLVSVSNDNKEKKVARNRQLKVLAGDLYSARFYQLLSDAGQIDMIAKLSAAICEINRLKVSLYMKMKNLKLKSEEYIELLIQLKMHLFIRFESMIDEKYRKDWSEILLMVTRCEVLQQELYKQESIHDYRDSWGFWYIMQHGSRDERKCVQMEQMDYTKLRAIVHKYNLISRIREMLETSSQALISKVNEFESESLKSELIHICEPFRHIGTKPLACEEL
ncbi:heptaprenyl diphosphate synthase component 1 [Paenibacillus sp. N1-5-1-14]|uniref:heptaprenyl diphosphate synthase component 1 n=1 Tax=Paenibacillus radicibacter TaxID=2972488 RepID=UPI002158F09E|nr:heptaprenyl diphosphate synthase component 1 [Paenibacillus radicibacter]MCR8642296.1 heptaprenyl diphosphate synthase component 1 [Paenibacillus radicibacter]